MLNKLQIAVVLYLCLAGAYRLFIANPNGKTKVNYYINNNPKNEKPITNNSCPLYTIFWHDCKQCNGLLSLLKKKQIKYYYINSRDYFDEGDLSSDAEPQFYENTCFIGNKFMDIYAAIERII